MAVKYSSIGGGTGTGFNVQIGSQYSYATFTQAQPAGAYTIKSSNNYTNWDVYLLDASNNLVAYTGSASIAPTTAFSAIVVVNGTLNDILQFSFASTVFSTATTSKTKAGPFITAFGSNVIPSIDSAVTITGGNFAVGILATFTGTDNVVRTCKSVVYTSTSSISVVRPDVLPIAYVPYTLTLTNPGVNNPTTSGKHLLTGLTVGNAPVWSTATSLPTAGAGAYSTTLVATDVEGAVTYSYVSGTLPSGLSFNSGTGVISGSYNGGVDGSTSYTVRATDTGGNFTDRTFTLAYVAMGGGALSSDSTYYYRTFTSNGTLSGASGLTVDLLVVAGGGGGGGGYQGGGGGAGGALRLSSQTLAANSIAVTVGAGGRGASNGSTPANGLDTSFGANTATGGGSGNAEMQAYGASGNVVGTSGGSGGGEGHPTYGSARSGVSGQGNAGGTNWGGCCSNGGGGGAGAVGSNAPSDGNAGAGGAGTNTNASWLSAISSVMTGVSGWASATSTGYIAGGGGGGNRSGGTRAAGGVGGGGQGSNNDSGATAIANTGGGGGGGGSSSGQGPGGAGGSGIVVVRYTKASVGG